MSRVPSGKTALGLTAITLLAMVFVSPAAFALPSATASIIFSPPSCSQPGCIGFNIQFTVTQDTNCPSDGFYSGDETITPPSGSPFTGSFPTTACGSSVYGINGIHPIEGQDVCAIPFAGTWTYEFKGTTYDAAGAPVAAFDVTKTYTVNPCTSAPEFPLGLALLFVLLVPALLVLRKRTLSFGKMSV